MSSDTKYSSFFYSINYHSEELENCPARNKTRSCLKGPSWAKCLPFPDSHLMFMPEGWPHARNLTEISRPSRRKRLLWRFFRTHTHTSNNPRTPNIWRVCQETVPNVPTNSHNELVPRHDAMVSPNHRFNTPRPCGLPFEAAQYKADATNINWLVIN